MRILPLRDAPQWLPTLAGLHHAQWQASHPGWTETDWQREFQRHLSALPCTLLALTEDGELRGSASLVEDDMNGATGFSPWLANVLVLPAARGQGAGSRLIAAIEAHAAAQGFTELHLFTEDQQALYQRRGWQRLQEMHFEGKAVSVMRKCLTASL